MGWGAFRWRGVPIHAFNGNVGTTPSRITSVLIPSHAPSPLPAVPHSASCSLMSAVSQATPGLKRSRRVRLAERAPRNVATATSKTARVFFLGHCRGTPEAPLPLAACRVPVRRPEGAATRSSAAMNALQPSSGRVRLASVSAEAWQRYVGPYGRGQQGLVDKPSEPGLFAVMGVPGVAAPGTRSGATHHALRSHWLPWRIR